MKPDAPPFTWNTPTPALPLFGRVTESAEVRQLLGKQRRVAILGSGGRGKTALAAEILRQVGPPPGHNGAWSRRLLLHDYSVSPAHDAVLPGLLTQAGMDVSGMSTETMTKHLRAKLGEPGTWLYLEGCEKAAQLPRLMEHTGLATVLLTTRAPHAPDGCTGYPLPPLSDADAADLIVSAASPGPLVRTPGHLELARFLGGHAFACRQAGNVMARRGWGTTELLAALRVRGLEALGGEEREHTSIQVLLQHTWELAWAESPGAADVWTVLALGALAPVPISILENAAVLPAADVATALDVLSRHGIARVEPIVSYDDGRTAAHWSLDHSLMREFILPGKSPHQSRVHAFHAAWREAWFAFLQAWWDAGRIPGGSQHYERLLPHFDALIDGIALREPADAHSHTLALTCVAALHSRQGRYPLAEACYRRDLTWCEEHYGPEDPDTLARLSHLADLLSHQGDLAGAVPLYRRVLEVRERTLGPEHPDVLVGRNHLGTLLATRGRLAEAEALFARAVAGARALLPPEHPDRQGYERNLALVREKTK